MRADHHEADLDSEVVSSRASSPPASPGPSQTPLLTASLNAPPRSYYGGLNGNVRVKCPTDLSVTLSTKNRMTQSNTDNQYSDSPSQGLSSPPPHHQAVFYSTLLKQLRQKAGDTSVGSAQRIHVVPVKIKKEKGSSLKALPFMCPACKKRFQRHIAMNAHFQNEHISPASASGERGCKLCGAQAPSLAAVRSHLRSVHNIDLDNPAKCLAEDPAAFSSTKYSVLEASLRAGSGPAEESEPSCSNIEMSVSESSRSSSPLPAHSSQSSDQSPERQSLLLYSRASSSAETQAAEDDLGQVEDLSLRRPTPASPVLDRPASSLLRPITSEHCSVTTNQRPASPAPRPESPLPCARAGKRPRLREPPTSEATCQASQSGQAGSPPPVYTCPHCSITFPNQALYFIHKGAHSDSNPWRCNGCGHQASDMYDFNSHLFSAAHQ